MDTFQLKALQSLRDETHRLLTHTTVHTLKSWGDIYIQFAKKHYVDLLRMGYHFRRSIPKSYNLSKNDLIDCILSPFHSEKSFALFKKFIGPQAKKLMEYLLWESQISQQQAEEQLGVVVYTNQKSSGRGAYSNNYQLKSEFTFLCMEWDYYSKFYGYTLALPTNIRAMMSSYYPKPASAKLRPIQGKPKGGGILFDKGEWAITEEWQRLLIYKKQGEIKYTQKGKPMASVPNKMIRKLGMTPFCPASTGKEAYQLRPHLIAGLLALLNERNEQRSVEGNIRYLFKYVFSKAYSPQHNILHYLKGMGHLSEDYDFDAGVNAVLLGVFKHIPPGGWITVDNIIDFCKYNFVSIKPLKQGSANRLYYSFKDDDNRTVKAKVEGMKGYRESLEIPTLKGGLFLLAAFGMLDIIFQPVPDNEVGRGKYFSPYDGISHVRMTNLGKYALGLERRYVPSFEAKKSVMTLSSESLSILTEEGDKTAEIVLSPFAEQISPNRFRVDASIFLNDCKSKKDLENKITLFKKSVSDSLPPNWETFIKDLRNKVDPLQELADIHIFQIPKDNPALIKLIARDDKLKAMCQKAEGFMVLVEKKKLNAFKKRLKEFGYLMP